MKTKLKLIGAIALVAVVFSLTACNNLFGDKNKDNGTTTTLSSEKL